MVPRKLCRQYVIPKKGNIDDVADAAIKSYTKILGYKPDLLTANQEDLYGMHVRIDVQVMAEHMQPNQLRLYEVVEYRTPRVLSVERVPVL